MIAVFKNIQKSPCQKESDKGADEVDAGHACGHPDGLLVVRVSRHRDDLGGVVHHRVDTGDLGSML
jgi:hypothetical protein